MQLAQTVQAFQHVILWKMSHLAEAAKLHEFIVVFHWTPKSRASKDATAHVTTLLCAVLCHPDQHRALGRCCAVPSGTRGQSRAAVWSRGWPWHAQAPGTNCTPAKQWICKPIFQRTALQGCSQTMTFLGGVVLSEPGGLLRNAKF